MRELIGGLLRRCATGLPKDVQSALETAYRRERGTGKDIIETLLENIKAARRLSRPMCQDTGTPIFYVTSPKAYDRENIRMEILAAVRDATRTVPLRPNAVDPVTGANSGDNTGIGFPVIHFGEWGRKKVRIELMLKGGGSENMTQLYRLPDAPLKAGRDMDGVARCVLDAVHKAQGRGCPPYVVGVGIGGLADETLTLSKRQLMRTLSDRNPDQRLAGLEKKLLDDINSLGIGPMGLGGKTTALAVKAGKMHRAPASYFVAVSFMCWACRRGRIEVSL
ncbi:MAG: fumarate hydratase [Candidatus Altiarchaeota archaeon]